MWTMLCALEEMRVMMQMETSEMLHKFHGVNRTNYQDKIKYEFEAREFGVFQGTKSRIHTTFYSLLIFGDILARN